MRRSLRRTGSTTTGRSPTRWAIPSDFYRVFMVPGMAHCGGGDGPNAFGNGTSNGPVIDADHDLVKALERWVEQGVAPERIIATHYVNNTAPGSAIPEAALSVPRTGRVRGQRRLERRCEFPMRRASRHKRSAQRRTAACLQRRKIARCTGGACNVRPLDSPFKAPRPFCSLQGPGRAGRDVRLTLPTAAVLDATYRPDRSR